jgi:hypothetical protein
MVVTLFLRYRIQQNLQVALPWAVVCLVLAASALASQVSLTSIVLALVGLLAIPGVLMLAQRPALGLLLIIPACVIVPFEIGTGTQSSLNGGILLVLGLLGLWLLQTLARKQRVALVRSRGITIALLLLICSAVLSFVVGQLPWFSVAPAPLRAQIGGLAVYVVSGGAFLLMAYRLRDERWLQWMVWIFLALGAIYVVGRVAPMPFRRAAWLFPRDATGGLFWVWMVGLAFSQALLNRKLGLGWRLVLAGLVAVTFYVAFVRMYDWKSGWLPPLATIAVILVARWWRFIIPLGVASLIVVGDMVSGVVASDTYSYSTRLEAWAILAEIIQRSPIFGLGPSNYYWYTSLYSIRGYYVQFNSHSQYVDLVAQLGIVGLVCFLWFAWGVGRLGWRLRIQAPEGFTQAYVYGALGGLAGTLVAGALGDWILPFVYNVGLGGTRASLLSWLFLGALVAIEGLLAQPAAVQSER